MKKKSLYFYLICLIMLLACSGSKNSIAPFDSSTGGSDSAAPCETSSKDLTTKGKLKGILKFSNAKETDIEFTYNEAVKRWDSEAVSINDIRKNYLELFLCEDLTVLGNFWPEKDDGSERQDSFKTEGSYEILDSQLTLILKIYMGARFFDSKLTLKSEKTTTSGTENGITGAEFERE